MKKLLTLSAALLISTHAPLYAQGSNEGASTVTVAPQDPIMAYIGSIQKEWARIKYQMPDENLQLDAIHKLEDYAARLTANYPTSAEAKIWEGIVLSTDAGIVKGMSALGKVKKAKALFEDALRLNPHAMDGSAYTSLGSLYYQVPGWPIAFGDNDEAEKNLKMALRLNPKGIDTNFFYGDYLLGRGRMEDAQQYLNRALQAPARPERPLADAGRKQEIRARLAEIRKKIDEKKRPKYN